ncbi:MAG: acylneuraminate cytidylyltransferase family protein [Alphaproteobacteria bacterium]|nr:acylneuraminate cytidylyltransferase family protein [Alphaproteobacteria bacterium]
MYASARILAVCPARGGSKGVKLKNLRPVMGVPIVARVGHLVRTLPEIDRAVVSTDHDEIAQVAEESGLAAPFRRPESLAGDRIGDIDVLCHALREMERIDATTYDVVLMLQPTSPLRTAEQVRATYVKLVDEKLDAVWTVSPADLKYHPRKALVVGEGGSLSYYDPDGGKIVARQQLVPVYYRTGLSYAFSRDCLLGRGTIMGARNGAVVTEGPAISIDTEEDFAAVERAMSARSGTPA